MPFRSKAQLKAAFAGRLGPEMRKKAAQWAGETPDIEGLPDHVGKNKPRNGPARKPR